MKQGLGIVTRFRGTWKRRGLDYRVEVIFSITCGVEQKRDIIKSLDWHLSDAGKNSSNTQRKESKAYAQRAKRKLWVLEKREHNSKRWQRSDYAGPMGIWEDIGVYSVFHYSVSSFYSACCV